MTPGLQNVVVPSRHFESSVSFYRDGLGLEVLQEAAGFCFLKAGSVNIAIHPADPNSEFAPTGHGLYLDLVVEDLGDSKEQLLQAGISIQKEWEDENRRFILVADPDGNHIELIEPREG